MQERDPLDWTGDGYDAFPRTARLPPPDDEWGLLDAAVCEAREGRFDLIRQLPAAIAKTTDLVFHLNACEFLGDAGGADELEALVRQLETAEFEEAQNIARALSERGRLVDVPAVFYFYEQHRKRKDAQGAHSWLGLWLCEGDGYFPEPGEGALLISWDEYRLRVGRRYFELWNRYGTNLIHIDRGEPFSLRRLGERMLASKRIWPHARHTFEANTGISGRRWFDVEGTSKPLRMAVDVERYLDSGRADQLPPGQRAFMGHPLEDVGAAVIDDSLLVRTVFDMDEMFELEFGWGHHGYFPVEGLPPPDSLIPTDTHRPWQSLHTCLRAAKEGRREVLGHLDGLLGPTRDSTFQVAAIELLADAADDHVIARWRRLIVECDNPDFVFDFCYGLLRRGLLCDIPLVLDIYAKYASEQYFYYIPFQVSLLLDRPGPESSLPATHEGPLVSPQEYCRRALARCAELRRVMPYDAVPMFRGQVASVTRVAELIARGVEGPDLRPRFEAATGIDCSSWWVPEKNPERAIETAREFLASGQADRYQPGRLYFFGHEVDLHG